MTESSTGAERGALVVAVNGGKAVVLTDNGFFLEVPFRGSTPRVGARYPLRAIPGAAPGSVSSLQCDILSAGGIAIPREQLPPPVATSGNIPAWAAGILQPRAARAWVHSGRWKSFAVAAVFLLACLWTLSAVLAGPAAVVAIDVNPSLNLTLDRHGRVLSAEPLDSEAANVLEGVRVVGLDVKEAITRVLDRAWDLGYLARGEQNVLFIAFTRLGLMGDALEWTPDGTYQAVERCLVKHDAGGIVFVYEARSQLYRQAHAAGLTVSRYLLGQNVLPEGQDGQAPVQDLREIVRRVGVSNLLTSKMVVGPVLQRVIPAGRDSSLLPGPDVPSRGPGGGDGVPGGSTTSGPGEANRQKPEPPATPEGPATSGAASPQPGATTAVAGEGTLPGAPEAVVEQTGELLQQVPAAAEGAVVSGTSAAEDVTSAARDLLETAGSSGLQEAGTTEVLGVLPEVTSGGGTLPVPLETSPDAGSLIPEGEPTGLLPPSSGEPEVPALSELEPVVPADLLQPAPQALPIP